MEDREDCSVSDLAATVTVRVRDQSSSGIEKFLRFFELKYFGGDIITVRNLESTSDCYESLKVHSFPVTRKQRGKMGSPGTSSDFRKARHALHFANRHESLRDSFDSRFVRLRIVIGERAMNFFNCFDAWNRFRESCPRYLLTPCISATIV